MIGGLKRVGTSFATRCVKNALVGILMKNPWNAQMEINGVDKIINN